MLQLLRLEPVGELNVYFSRSYFLNTIISLLCHCDKQLLWRRGGALLNPDGVKEVKSFRVNCLYIFNVRRQRNKLAAHNLFSLYNICMSCLFKCHVSNMLTFYGLENEEKFVTCAHDAELRMDNQRMFVFMCFSPLQFAVYICKCSRGSTCCWSQKSRPLLMFYLLCLFQSLKWRKNV